MTPADDFPSEMDQFPFAGSDADSVFGASSETDSVPEDLRDVTELVRAARRTGSPDALAGADVIVAQIAAAIGGHAASPAGDAHERTRVSSKFRTAKAAAAATAVLMLGGTAAAAATGTLPSPVQHSVASGLSGVGINLPVHHEIKLAAHHAATSATATADHHARARRVPGAFGTVASVNGMTDPTACGSGVSGVFTLTGPKGKTFTVNVGQGTVFVNKGVTSPSFADVCVGALAAAKGTVVDATVTATKVFVAPPRPPHVPSGARGTVVSVNSNTASTACGTSGAAGTFTLTARKSKTFTVNVDTATKFRAFGMTGVSFANVCVGAKVGVEGVVTDTTVAATGVFVFPAHADEHHDGFHSNKGHRHLSKQFASHAKKVDSDHDDDEGQRTGGSGATGGTGAKAEVEHRHGHGSDN